MEKENIVRDKSFKFALRIVKLYKYLISEKQEYVLCKQILRCGTSIGANIEEAIGVRTKKDFINKIAIAYKEAREARYWIRLLRDSNYLESNLCVSLLSDCEELVRLTEKIISTGKLSLEK